MGGSSGGAGKRAGSRAIRLLAAVGKFIMAMLTDASCVWAPEIYFHIVLDRNIQLGNPPPGHPEVLCPEVPPSQAEIDLWSRLGR